MDAIQPISAYKLQKELVQEEMDKLVNEFGKGTVEDYIERTKAYNCCSPATIRQWILADSNKKPKSSNQFNNFMQRDMTKKEVDELERRLLKQLLIIKTIFNI